MDSEEPIVYGDDGVIGRALWISAGLALAGGAAAGLVWLLWPGPPPVTAVPAAVVTGPAVAVSHAAPPERRVPFTDVTRSAGVTWARTDGADGRKLLPETMGGGVAIADFDGDGRPDLAFADGDAWPDAPVGTPRGEGVVVYLNRTNPPTAAAEAPEPGGSPMRFERADAPELAAPGPLMGLSAADVDGDGRVDLLVTGVHGVRMYRNITRPGEPVRFEDITKASGLDADTGWSTSAGFADVDGDGDLDLVLLHYVDWSPEIDARVDYRLAGVGRAYGPPTGFPGTQVSVYEQVSPLVFEDRSEERGVLAWTPGTRVPVAKGLGLALEDLDGDGDVDILVANDKVRKFLLVNDGSGHFVERGIECGFAFDRVGVATGAMGIDVARLRPGSGPSVAVGNFANEPSGLYAAPPGTLRFTDDAIVEGISAATRPFLTFGLGFMDLDLDGRPDFVQANGHIEEEIARAQANQAYRQRTQVFLNAGDGSHGALVELPPSAMGDLAEPLIGRGLAWADLDGDGDVDLVVGQSKGPPAIFRNDLPADPARSWVTIALEDPGSPNRQGIGAVVGIPGPGGVLPQTVMPVRSYLSSVPAQVHVGVPPGSDPVVVSVRWPDGVVEEHRVPRGARTTLVRGRH
jgi:hypothetical protein